MTVIDLRCRPAYLHDFFGATPGSPEFETARWLNRRVGAFAEATLSGPFAAGTAVA